MRLVDDQHRVVTVGDSGEVGERSPVAVHRIEAFDRDPWRAGAAACAPAEDSVFKGLRVVMRSRCALGAAEFHPVVRARMDQRVVDEQVAALRQRREQRGVGREAGGEEERRLGAIVARRMRLERFMLGMVAAQQPRAARTGRNAACGALRQRFGERVGTR